MNKFIFSNTKGFTIIEILVAGLIFSMIAVMVGSIFSQVVYLQRRVFSAQEIQENAFYVVETLSRDIRESRVCTIGTCTTGPQTYLQIAHPRRGNIAYAFDEVRGVITKTEGGSTVDITSSNVNFTRFNFYVYHQGIDNMQSKVVMVISVSNRLGPSVIIDSQATVISRDFSDEFLN